MDMIDCKPAYLCLSLLQKQFTNYSLAVHLLQNHENYTTCVLKSKT